MRRWFQRLVLAALAMTAAWAQGSIAAAQDAVASRWQGKVTQIGSSEIYTVLMALEGRGGETDYPELDCGGELDRIGGQRGYVVYYETITRGRYDPGTNKGCVDGTITIFLDGNQLHWGWFGAFDGKPVVAYASLDPL